jgi:hypothetical protein
VERNSRFTISGFSFDTPVSYAAGRNQILRDANRTRTLPLPPVVGIAAVAGGAALLVVGMRKHA